MRRLRGPGSRHGRHDGGQQAAHAGWTRTGRSPSSSQSERAPLPARLPAARRSAPARPPTSSGRPRASSPTASSWSHARDRRGSTPDDDSVVLTDGRSLPYDYLVIATGTSPRPDQTPGMLDGGQWRDSIHEFYTFDGALALRDKLRDFPGGRVVVHIVEMPIKCPVAPLEFAFLADAYFRDLGMRDQVELDVRDAAAGRVHQADRVRAARRDARRAQDRPRAGLRRRAHRRRAARRWSRTTSARCRSTCSSPCRSNMGADYVARSGLGDELNYVPVDKHTLLSTGARQHLRRRRRLGHPGLEGRLGRALLRRDLRRQLRSPTSTGSPMNRQLRRARQLLRRVRRRQGAAHRLQLRHRAAARHLPGAARRAVPPARGDPGQPLGQARVPLDLLAPAAARPTDPPPGPHVDGRQESRDRTSERQEA